ncbi:nuclease-related domain-containing protein [Nocardia sp. NPDC051750]|uniref:nuclease-related domain-containing protein n=1 Tax=Nocardia sp. NPDC051750 TaxID=3364325 RepID=UPI00378FD96C
MLVLNGDRTDIHDTERHVIDWLRTSGLPGVALSGCHTPGGETDLVVFTPDAAIVIEVKGLRRRIPDATLWCPNNGRWNVPGIAGDPVHVRPGDTSPWDQLGAKIFGAKNMIEPACGPVRVAGLVLVVAHPGTRITIRPSKGPNPYGSSVLAGHTADDLTGWIRQRTGQRTRGTWTVPRMLAALAALDTGSPLTAAELAAAGFPPGDTTTAAVPPRPVPAPTAAPFIRTAPAPRPPRPHRAPRRPGRRGGLGRTVAALAGIAATAVVVLALAIVLNTLTRPVPATEPAPVPASVHTPAPPPPPAPAPSPTRSSCWPFDAAC